MGVTDGNGMTQKELLLHIWREVQAERDERKVMVGSLHRIETKMTGHVASGDAHDIPELREALKNKGGALRTVGLSLASSATTALILAGLFAGRAG